MKRNAFFMLLAVLLVTVFTGCTKVESGYVGLKIKLLGDGKGSMEVLPPGIYNTFMQFNVDYVTMPVFVKQYPFTQSKTEGSPTDEAIYFQSKDGGECNVDIAVEATVDKNKADTLYSLYRKSMEEIIHTNVRQSLRELFSNYASSMSVEELYSSKKVDLLNSIKKDLVARYDLEGLMIKSVSYLGNIRFPPSIMAAIEAKNTAVQETIKRENEVAKAKAEADIAIAQARGLAESRITEARGEAEAARLKSATVNSSTLELERLAIQKIIASAWDGKLPAIQGGGTGSGGMVLDLRGIDLTSK